MYQTRALDVISAMREYSANAELEILLHDFFGNELTVETASPQELSRLRSHLYLRRRDLDNEHYQYQNGFLDPDFYHTTTDPEIKAFAPCCVHSEYRKLDSSLWRKLTGF